MCKLPCDCASELQRLRDRELQLIVANNAELQRRRGFEAEANQAHCELILLSGECIRLRELNGILSDFLETGTSLEIPAEIQEAVNAVFPPEVAAIVGTRVQSPSLAEVLDQAIAAVWHRATCACAVPVLEELRTRMTQI